MACVHICPRKTRENRSTHLPITPDCTFFNLRLNASGLAVSAHRFLSLRHRLASSPARIVADPFVTEPVPPPSSTASLLSILETGSWKRDVFPKGFSSGKAFASRRGSQHVVRLYRPAGLRRADLAQWWSRHPLPNPDEISSACVR